MQKLKSDAPSTFEHKIWVWYVDNVFAVIKNDNLESIHHKLNNTAQEFVSRIEKENHGTLFSFGCDSTPNIHQEHRNQPLS